MDIELLKKTPDLRAIADIRLATLEDGPARGQRLLIARNATGIAFEVALDRGFDISSLSFRGPILVGTRRLRCVFQWLIQAPKAAGLSCATSMASL